MRFAPLFVLLVASSAAAETASTAAPAQPDPVTRGLMRGARDAAARGDCTTAHALSSRAGKTDDLALSFYCKPTATSWEHAYGWTFEAGTGVSAISTTLGGNAIAPSGSMGIGKFVSPGLALSLRFASTIDSDELGLGGVLAPHAQAWLGDHAFAGAGIGVAVGAECDTECDAGAGGLGVDARLGYALRKRGESGMTIALEGTSSTYGALFGIPLGAYAASLQLGYQYF